MCRQCFQSELVPPVCCAAACVAFAECVAKFSPGARAGCCAGRRARIERTHRGQYTGAILALACQREEHPAGCALEFARGCGACAITRTRWQRGRGMGFVIMRRCAPQMAAPAEAEQDFERKKSSSNELTSPSTISVTCVCSPPVSRCVRVWREQDAQACPGIPRHVRPKLLGKFVCVAALSWALVRGVWCCGDRRRRTTR